MSLSDTHTYPGASDARRSWLQGLGMIAAGFVLGVVIGLVFSTGGPATEGAHTAPINHSALSHEEFVRLNTTDLPNWVSAGSANAVEPPAPVDPFIYQNVTSLDELASANSGGANDSNTTTEFSPSGPR